MGGGKSNAFSPLLSRNISNNNHCYTMTAWYGGHIWEIGEMDGMVLIECKEEVKTKSQGVLLCILNKK